MKANCFLIVNDSGSVRTTKNRPDLKWNEVSVGLKIELPNSLFQRPQLTASLVVGEDAVCPPEITAETLQAVKQAIETGTGLEVKISIAEAPDP